MMKFISFLFGVIFIGDIFIFGMRKHIGIKKRKIFMLVCVLVTITLVIASLLPCIVKWDKIEDAIAWRTTDDEIFRINGEKSTVVFTENAKSQITFHGFTQTLAGWKIDQPFFYGMNNRGYIYVHSSYAIHFISIDGDQGLYIWAIDNPYISPIESVSDSNYTYFFKSEKALAYGGYVSQINDGYEIYINDEIIELSQIREAIQKSSATNWNEIIKAVFIFLMLILLLFIVFYFGIHKRKQNNCKHV